MTGRPRKQWSLSFEEVLERYERGESLRSLATACGLVSLSPLQRELRAAGVLRPRGSRPGVQRTTRTSRVCKRDGCENEFEVYPTQNRVYCQPSCRYSDPELAALLNRNISGRHALSEIDSEAQRAVCSVCGPTEVRRRHADRVHATTVTWRCCTAERARVWAKEMGVSVEQVEKWLVEQGGVCAICGGDNDGKMLRVDHCHEKIEGRGLLCDRCNLGLGIFNDDPVRLRAAAAYLETKS